MTVVREATKSSRPARRLIEAIEDDEVGSPQSPDGEDTAMAKALGNATKQMLSLGGHDEEAFASCSQAGQCSSMLRRTPTYACLLVKSYHQGNGREVARGAVLLLCREAASVDLGHLKILACEFRNKRQHGHV